MSVPQVVQYSSNNLSLRTAVMRTGAQWGSGELKIHPSALSLLSSCPEHRQINAIRSPSMASSLAGLSAGQRCPGLERLYHQPSHDGFPGWLCCCRPHPRSDREASVIMDSTDGPLAQVIYHHWSSSPAASGHGRQLGAEQRFLLALSVPAEGRGEKPDGAGGDSRENGSPGAAPTQAGAAPSTPRGERPRPVPVTSPGPCASPRAPRQSR